jgi:hypothetical protein
MVVPESYETTAQLFTELILKTSRVAQPFSNGDAMVTFGWRWPPRRRAQLRGISITVLRLDVRLNCAFSKELAHVRS